jgi:hypothetical protein
MALALADRNQDWDDRGHIAAHDVDHVRDYLGALLLQRRAARAGHGLSEARRRRLSKQINDMTMALLRHYMSFDKATRPRQEFSLPKMKQPWLDLDESVFQKMTRFYKKEFLSIVDSLSLLPDTIRDPGTGCKASKQLAVFILLRRWAGAEHWCGTPARAGPPSAKLSGHCGFPCGQKSHRCRLFARAKTRRYVTEREMRSRKSWLIAIYGAVLRAMHTNYQKVVTMIDFRCATVCRRALCWYPVHHLTVARCFVAAACSHWSGIGRQSSQPGVSANLSLSA